MAENQYSRSELEVEGAENAGVLCSLLLPLPGTLKALYIAVVGSGYKFGKKCRNQNLDRNLADQINPMNPYPVPDKNCGESDD